MLGSALASCRLVLKTVSLSWSELARRTWREVGDDDVLGMAAQLAYYFFLALFPAMLFLLALASFFPLPNNLTDNLGRALGPFVSDGCAPTVRRSDAAAGQRGEWRAADVRRSWEPCGAVRRQSCRSLPRSIAPTISKRRGRGGKCV